MTTYPNTDDYDLEEALTQLGIGEAMVTILSERGTPTPVVWTKMLPPQSSMAAVPTERLAELAKASPLWATYGVEIDRESAREMLAAKLVAAAPASEPAPAPKAPKSPKAPKPARPKATAKPKAATNDDDNFVVDFLKSREGRSATSRVVRGVFDMLTKKK